MSHKIPVLTKAKVNWTGEFAGTTGMGKTPKAAYARLFKNLLSRIQWLESIREQFIALESHEAQTRKLNRENFQKLTAMLEEEKRLRIAAENSAAEIQKRMDVEIRNQRHRNAQIDAEVAHISDLRQENAALHGRLKELMQKVGEPA